MKFRSSKYNAALMTAFLKSKGEVNANDIMIQGCQVKPGFSYRQLRSDRKISELALKISQMQLPGCKQSNIISNVSRLMFDGFSFSMENVLNADSKSACHATDNPFYTRFRFSRKITPFASNMRDLTKNWFFIFAWSGVCKYFLVAS